MFCRNCGREIPPGNPVCMACGVPAGAGKNHCPNCGAPVSELAVMCPNCACPLGRSALPQSRSRLVAGILGILLGSLGIHNFYLGNNNRGLTQLLITLIAGPLTCGLAAFGTFVWGLVEGIQILTGTVNCDAQGRPLGE